MKRVRILTLLVATVAVGGVVLTACGDDTPPETRLFVLDGVEFRLDDVAPYVAFLDSFLPEGGRKTKIMRVLEEHLIPLRLAQRAFPTERREQQEAAMALRSIASNVQELTAHAAMVKNQMKNHISRTSALLPVAIWAFEPLHMGAVSDPIEVPYGWLVVGCHEITESPGLAMDDYVDAHQVGFVTHTAGDWFKWYEAQKPLLANKATFFHPDYVTAIPQWIQPPKLP